MSSKAVCPGSYDPVTNGHLDVITRAARRFDEVVVAVVGNPSKQPTFTAEERVAMVAAEIEELVAGGANVRVMSFDGLLVDFCRDHGIGVICKGLRGVADFESEQQMAQMNTRIGDVETMFLATRPDLSYLSSSLVREVAALGGSITGMVPASVERALIERVRRG
ncbi:MAG: pantetheine-phosphate adenylyltransferase [Nitriliruptoraceae bacterium]